MQRLVEVEENSILVGLQCSRTRVDISGNEPLYHYLCIYSCGIRAVNRDLAVVSAKLTYIQHIVLIASQDSIF